MKDHYHIWVSDSNDLDVLRMHEQSFNVRSTANQHAIWKGTRETRFVLKCKLGNRCPKPPKD